MSQPRVQPKIVYEVDVPAGLEIVVHQELRQALGKLFRLTQPLEAQVGSGALSFYCHDAAERELATVLRLRTVLSAYRVLSFAIPRPKALLAHAHFTQLTEAIGRLREQLPAGYYQNFGISAAGAESVVFQQLATQLADALKLPFAPEEIDLLLRIRPAQHQPSGQPGWEVLVRLSPRPLSVRPWRVVDLKGALNAAVAQAMVRLSHSQPTDRFLNLACGSGTLLIERLLASPAKRVIGCDIAPEALQAAQANVRAARLQNAVELYDWDARALNLPAASIDALCADLPFGIAVGAHEQNVAQYGQILQEAARVAKAKSHFVVMTQEVTLMEQLLQSATTWKVLETIKVDLRGLQPRIFVLQRTGVAS